MNIPVIVDVAIGLIFIYLILSLLASEILELIATVLQWRAKHLREAIINLLAGDTITDQNIEAAKRLTKDLYNHPLLNDLNQEARGLFATLFRKITWVFSWFYQWLTGGERVFGNKVSAPSYIPGETFATALIERLGVAKLVETLIEAKLARFKDSILEYIDSLISGDIREELKGKLEKICEKFNNRELTLVQAIDEISSKIDQSINKSENEEQKKKLASWKRGLFGKQNELAIVNGGLKPTLEEVTDLVNLSSRTYQVFKNEFRTYSQKRQEQFKNELLNFLLVFDLSIKIIADSEKTFAEDENVISSIEENYSEILNAVSTPPKISISLSEIGMILIKEHLNEPGKLKDFKEGFGEQGQELLHSKIFRRKQILIGVSLISLLVVPLLAVFTLRELLITPQWGIVFVITLVVLFILFIRYCNIKPNPSNLLNKVDGFFSSILNLEKNLSPESSIEESRKILIEKFITDFKKEIKSLEEDKSLLQWELSRLGQSFRQYYRAQGKRI